MEELKDELPKEKRNIVTLERKKRVCVYFISDCKACAFHVLENSRIISAYPFKVKCQAINAIIPIEFEINEQAGFPECCPLPIQQKEKDNG